jgi:hypothetical protein
VEYARPEGWGDVNKPSYRADGLGLTFHPHC